MCLGKWERAVVYSFASVDLLFLSVWWAVVGVVETVLVGLVC